MAVNIVTGRTGTEHITSDDFRAMNASVLERGNMFLIMVTNLLQRLLQIIKSESETECA